MESVDTVQYIYIYIERETNVNPCISTHVVKERRAKSHWVRWYTDVQIRAVLSNSDFEQHFRAHSARSRLERRLRKHGQLWVIQALHFVALVVPQHA